MKIEKSATKEEIFNQIQEWLVFNEYEIAETDKNRPWGGFFVIDERQIAKFQAQFFASVEFSEEQMKQKLSPKILIVAPGKRLSWQYHHRRAEIWKLVGGEGGIVTSPTDELGELVELKLGEVVELAKGERHRLVGMDNWGIVAEIWMHTDPNQPSNEDDIVRVEDDFQRK